VSLRTVLVRGGEAIVVLVVASLVLGSLLGQPILLSFVETGSMEPTIGQGDGFVAIPSQVSGPVEEGDVVVFQAEELHGGGLTTHRVVGETQDGYVTKGDANPFTDQDGAEPPVTEDQIVAEALQINGVVVTIPAVGSVVGAIQQTSRAAQAFIASIIGIGSPTENQGQGAMLMTMGVVLLVITFVYDAMAGPRRSVGRNRTRPGVVDTRRVALVLLVIVLLPANLAMVLPGGVHDVSIDGDAVADASDLEPGEATTWEYRINNYGIIPVVATFDTENPDVSLTSSSTILNPRSESRVDVDVTVPPPGEQTRATFTEHRYLMVLPPSLILALHAVDPTLAWLVVNGWLAAIVAAAVGAFAGYGPKRLRTRSGVAWKTRLRRRFG
jgi:signal peptidase